MENSISLGLGIEHEIDKMKFYSELTLEKLDEVIKEMSKKEPVYIIYTCNGFASSNPFRQI